MKQKTIDLEFDLINNNYTLLKTVLTFGHLYEEYSQKIKNNEDNSELLMDLVEQIKPKLIFKVRATDESYDHAFGTRKLEGIALVYDEGITIEGTCNTHSFRLGNTVLKHLLSHTTYDRLIEECTKVIHHWDGSYEDFGD